MLTCIHCGTILTSWIRHPYCTPCIRSGGCFREPIPLEDTPIYAAMVRLVTTADRLAKEHPELPPLPARKPLAKKGRKR